MFPRCILVMLLCGGLYHAAHVSFIGTLEVEAGESVLLPCNGSAFLGEEGSAHWEATGDDVAFVWGQEIGEGEKFKGRVQLMSEEELRQGNWSVSLDPVMLSDGDMYECIWKGVRVLSTVWLKVKIPDYQSSHVVYVGEKLALPCFIQISRSQSVRGLQIWWTRNGRHLDSAELKDLEDVVAFNPDSQSQVAVWNRGREIQYLLLDPVKTADDGEYHCWYETEHSNHPKTGVPESITVTVLETPHSDTVLPTSTEDWVSTPHWPVLPVTEEATTAGTPLDLVSVELESSTYPIKVTTESQPMEVFEETATSFPLEETSSESVQWDSLPWVRIGLISGVLAVTAVTLCILGALRKI